MPEVCVLSRRGFLAAAVCGAQAQEPAPPTITPAPPTFTVDVSLVNIGFTVRDRRGTLVARLEKSDFDVFEDGGKQEVKQFVREEETPLTLGLILDRSPSQDRFEEENVYAAITFFRRVLRPVDRAFVSAFGNRVKLIADSTNSREGLERALKTMADNYDRSPRLGPDVLRIGGSAVLDAVFHSADEKLKGVAGRKALIMIGDGKENSSKRKLVDVIDLLQAEDTLFYGIANSGEDSASNRRLRDLMPVIAEETGGREFRQGEMPLRQAFEEIERELRTLYTVAYNSSNPARDGRFRKVEVRPKDARLVVRARPGYYAR